MSTKICGTCAYYRDTALHGIICGKTKKPCGYLHEKDCWTAARKQAKIPKVEIHKEVKVSKSVTINARLVSMGLDSSGIGSFEFVTSKSELRKLAPLWGNEELTVTVTSVEIVKD